MAIFPVANVTDVQDIYTIFRFANFASGEFFFLAIIGVVWFVAFIGAIVEGRKAYRGFIFANFVCAPLAIILGLLGLLDTVWIYVFVILLAFAIAWGKLSESKG